MAFWDKTRSGSKVGFNRLYSWVDKLGPPVNKLSNKLGNEAFWPTSMDKECDKAARILRSFCTDGFYTEEQTLSPSGPNRKAKVLKKIPAEVIQNAQGLAIFTAMRNGLWLSGSGGSGVLVARRADGAWSSPSGIQVQTVGLGFLVGVDIYDCVLVINTQKALEAFTRFRTTIGGDLSVAAGPYGIGGIVDSEIHRRQAPIFTYLKSRGFYAGVQLDGTVVIERTDENERFYGEKIKAQDILKGKIRHPPLECRGLYETLKAAEGAAADVTLMPSTPPPSDYEIVQEDHIFGVPDKSDPDPYGVLQLEKEGMVIREAGTKQLASWEQFTFAPSVTSPVYETFEKRSNRDSSSQIVSRRGSYMTNSGRSINTNVISEARSSKDTPRTPTSMIDMSTQTDDLPPPPQSPGRLSFRSGAGSTRASMRDIPEHQEITSASPSHSRPNSSWSNRRNSHPANTGLLTPPSSSPLAKPMATEDDLHSAGIADLDASADESSDEEVEEAVIIEAPVVQSMQKVTAPQAATQKARVVDVPKRGPPPLLPPRNPNRASSNLSSSDRSPSRTTQHIDSGLPSPSLTLQDFSDVKARPAVTPMSEPTPASTPDETDGKDPWSTIFGRHNSSNNSRESLQQVPGAF